MLKKPSDVYQAAEYENHNKNNVKSRLVRVKSLKKPSDVYQAAEYNFYMYTCMGESG